MRLTARPVMFGAPLLVALALGMALWAWSLAASGGTTSPVGATWNVEYWQRSAAGVLIDHKILHNTLTAVGKEAAMQRLVDTSVVNGLVTADTYDKIVLVDATDWSGEGNPLLSADIVLGVDGAATTPPAASPATANNPAQGGFSDGGGDGVGDGTVTVGFRADETLDPVAIGQMLLVKSAVVDTVANAPTGDDEVLDADVIAFIEISVDLAVDDTLTISWTIDVN